MTDARPRRRAGLARLLGVVGLVLAGSALSPVAGRAATPAAPQQDTGVVNASTGTGYPQTEQTMAVDPTNPNNIAISWISFGMSVSHDGGVTWAISPLGANACVGDNNPVFDQAGTLFYQCDNQAITDSRDKGATWVDPPVVPYTIQDNNNDLTDRPWLVRGTTQGTLYIGWESFFTTPSPGYVFVKRSTDGGATWPGPATRVDDPNGLIAGKNPREYPAVGSDGTVYLSYWTDAGGGSSYVVARSHDGAATFARVVAAPKITRSASPAEEGEAISSLAADPDPSRAGHLVLTWADERSKEGRILMVSSVDGGVTWSAPVDVTDDPAGKGDNHDHPQARFAPDGRVIVVWKDRRCCSGAYTDSYELFARALNVTPAGVTASSNSVRVTDTRVAPNQIQNIDEYMALAVGPEGVSVAWNQPVNGTAATFFRRMPLTAFAAVANPTPVTAPARPSGTASAPGSAPNTAGEPQGDAAAVAAIGLCMGTAALANRGRGRRRRPANR